MRKFMSLKPERLPLAFDAEIHTEEPMVEVEESKGRIVVSYTFPGFYISDDSRDVDGEEIPFSQINVASTGFLGESGKPLLPSFGRYVQIPFNCDYKITVEKREPVKFDDMLVLPAQEHLTDSPEGEQVFEYDRELYEKDIIYPEENVRVTGPFNIDDYTAILIHVMPLQYNPGKKQLIGYGNIIVTIDIAPKKKLEEQPAVDPDLNREAYGNFFLNPRRGISERLEITPPERTVPYFQLQGPEYLIIYHDKFKKVAEKLALWKNMRGLRTETISINSVGNGVNQIKTYIRKARGRKFSRLRYVLLFGDVDMIASYDTSGEPWGAGQWPAFWGNNITDYYYSTSRDPTGSGDFVLPWLSIGRIPVRTASEGMSVVNQIISYERNPPRDSSYYERMAFAAYFQDTNGDGKADRAYMQTMEAIREHMITIGYNVGRIYVSTAGAPTPQLYIDNTPVPADVIASISDPLDATSNMISATTQGQLMAAHRDHGDTGGWSHPTFNTAHLDTITGKTPTMFYSVNCLTGQFDLTAPIRESFAEKLLRMKGAAPSLVAATRVSHTWLNNDLMKGLFDAMWGGVLPTFPSGIASYPVRRNRLGDILNYGKVYLTVALSGSSEYIKDQFEIYHIIGDPTLEIWRTKPLRERISAWVRGRYLYIRLYRVIKDSVLTLWSGEEMLRRLEPSSTFLKIALPWSVDRRKLFICYWAPGYRFRLIRPLSRSTSPS